MGDDGKKDVSGDGTVLTTEFTMWSEGLTTIQDENTNKIVERGDDVTLHDSLVEARKLEIESYYGEDEESDDSEADASANDQEQSEEELLEDKATEEEMAESQHSADIIYDEYVVRGAILRCTCGSHCRRLNLPKSHNYYMDGRPLMNANDSIPGSKARCESEVDKNKINIPYFGVCQRGNSPGDSVLLKKDKPRDPYGNILEEESKQENFWNKKIDDNVRGPVCEPKILSRWLCPDENCLVDGVACIKGDSFLVCEYGGLIEVLQSGQALEDNIDDV